MLEPDIPSVCVFMLQWMSNLNPHIVACLSDKLRDIDTLRIFFWNGANFCNSLVNTHSKKCIKSKEEVHPPACEDGTDRVFRNVGIYNWDAGELPKRKHTILTLGSFALHFGLKYETIYQLDAIEYLFVFFQLNMFRAYTPPTHTLLRTDT